MTARIGLSAAMEKYALLGTPSPNIPSSKVTKATSQAAKPKFFSANGSLQNTSTEHTDLPARVFFTLSTKAPSPIKAKAAFSF